MASLDATVNVGKFINLAERQTLSVRHSGFSGNRGLVLMLVVHREAFMHRIRHVVLVIRKAMTIVYLSCILMEPQHGLSSRQGSQGSTVGGKYRLVRDDLRTYPSPIILYSLPLPPFPFSFFSSTFPLLVSSSLCYQSFKAVI